MFAPRKIFPVGALLSYCDLRKNLSSTKSYRDTMTYVAPCCRRYIVLPFVETWRAASLVK